MRFVKLVAETSAQPLESNEALVEASEAVESVNPRPWVVDLEGKKTSGNVTSSSDVTKPGVSFWEPLYDFELFPRRSNVFTRAWVPSRPSPTD